jgi:hypothetical protein
MSIDEAKISTTEWISVKDKTPKIKEDLIFLNGKNEVTVGECFAIEDKNMVWIHDYSRGTNEIATYWMPLPSPPEKTDKYKKMINLIEEWLNEPGDYDVEMWPEIEKFIIRKCKKQ